MRALGDVGNLCINRCVKDRDVVVVKVDMTFVGQVRKLRGGVESVVYKFVIFLALTQITSLMQLKT